jgi:hypothetical protein
VGGGRSAWVVLGFGEGKKGHKLRGRAKEIKGEGEKRDTWLQRGSTLRIIVQG